MDIGIITTVAHGAGGVMGGSALASWRPVVVLLSVVGGIMVLLWTRGTSPCGARRTC